MDSQEHHVYRIIPNKQNLHNDNTHAYSDSENFKKDQNNYQKKYSTFFTNDLFTNNSNKGEEDSEKIGYNNSYKQMLLNNQINQIYNPYPNFQKQTEHTESAYLDKNAIENNLIQKQIDADNDSFGFNIPVQSTNQTQITNSAANKNLVESSNAILTANDFEIPTNKNNNYNNRNIINNDLIYNHLQENLIIPRNYNQNPPIAARPRTNRKKYIFCLSLLIILLLIVICGFFLLFFTDFFNESYFLNFYSAYSNSAKAEKNKSIINLLSNLQIDCSDSGVLTSFNLETQNYSDYYYKFTCGEAFYPDWCQKISKQSNWVLYNELLENEFEALSKLTIICPYEYGISSLKLNYEAFGKIYFDYSCVKIKGAARFRVECRDSSTPSSEVRSRDPSSILDLKCQDNNDSSRFLNTIQLNYKEKHGWTRANYWITSCRFRN